MTVKKTASAGLHKNRQIHDYFALTALAFFAGAFFAGAFFAVLAVMLPFPLLHAMGSLLG